MGINTQSLDDVETTVLRVGAVLSDAFGGVKIPAIMHRKSITNSHEYSQDILH
eukprot:COSAG01_NODE_68819_length_263_cov_0.621951_2_plen_52_part_01